MKPRIAIDCARWALRHGYLVRCGHLRQHYRYEHNGRSRRFSGDTVKVLLDGGEAVRSGDYVRIRG